MLRLSYDLQQLKEGLKQEYQRRGKPGQGMSKEQILEAVTKKLNKINFQLMVDPAGRQYVTDGRAHQFLEGAGWTLHNDPEGEAFVYSAAVGTSTYIKDLIPEQAPSASAAAAVAPALALMPTPPLPGMTPRVTPVPAAVPVAPSVTLQPPLPPQTAKAPPPLPTAPLVVPVWTAEGSAVFNEASTLSTGAPGNDEEVQLQCFVVVCVCFFVVFH